MEVIKLSVVTPVQSNEIASLNGYLSALEFVLKGVNYVTLFEAKAFTIDGEQLPINEVILTAYPDSTPHQAHVEECDLATMLSQIKECFSDTSAYCIATDASGTIAQNIMAGF